MLYNATDCQPLLLLDLAVFDPPPEFLKRAVPEPPYLPPTVVYQKFLILQISPNRRFSKILIPCHGILD
jgi:hypothetical protein